MLRFVASRVGDGLWRRVFQQGLAVGPGLLKGTLNRGMLNMNAFPEFGSQEFNQQNYPPLLDLHWRLVPPIHAGKLVLNAPQPSCNACLLAGWL